MPRELTFQNMIPAMAKFHATKDSLYAELDAMADSGDMSDKAFTLWNARCTKNDNTIREAYYLDTSDRNSRSIMDMVSAESLIELAEKIL